METKKTYLGDAVYASLDQHGGIMLTTEDGLSATNNIMLEPETLTSFLLWLQVVKGVKL